ncbi:uncharacterized protein [Haliotis asinina]|uniref:uncharacterized protein n=1 Tax=Haliotis asinina TaxID=109174 RepID=UPI0035317FD5
MLEHWLMTSHRCCLELEPIRQTESISIGLLPGKAFYNLRYAHSSLGFVSPTENGLVKNVLEGAKRKLAKFVIKKEPITYIFRGVTKCASGYILRKGNVPLSYTRLREIFIDALRPYVDNIKQFGLHSLRRGGATAAENSGLPDRMFKRHARWRSEKAKDGYIKDSLEQRMKVSLSLGL